MKGDSSYQVQCFRWTILIVFFFGLSDQILVGYEFPVYNTTETTGYVTLCVALSSPSGGAPRPFILNATTSDGSAIDGVDYIGIMGFPLMFGEGDTRICYNVVIIQDDICEKVIVENFFSNLVLAEGDMSITITRPQTEVIIDDNAEPECGPITVGYDPDSYTVSETDGSVTLTIRVFSPTGGAPRPFNLSISTVDGTATVVDGDYVPVNGEIVTFNTGDVTQTHTIIINQDNICENGPNEIFSDITLAGGIPDVIVTVPRATITIDDTAEPECEVTHSSTIPLRDRINGTIIDFNPPNARSTPIASSITREFYTATASNRAGSSSTTFTDNIEVMLLLFQIRLEGIFDCLQWKESEANEKREIVITSIIGAVNDICQCDFSRDSFHNIESTGGFQCFESSPTAVTFRASIMDSVEANVFQLVRYIKQWVQSDPTIVVMSSRLSVDGDCEVEIKSFNDPECGSTSFQGNELSSIIGPIVGGVLGGIVGLALCLIIIPIPFLIKKHRKSYKVKEIDLYETIPSGQMVALSPVDSGTTVKNPSHAGGSHIPTEENVAYATNISATDNPAYATNISATNNPASATNISATDNPAYATNISATDNPAYATNISATNNPAYATSISATNNPAYATNISATDNPAYATTRQ